MNAVANIPTITVKRRIAASAQELFDAWLNPESLAEWMRPCSTGTRRSVAKVDARVGGAFEVVMHVASGQVSHSGVYQTIDPPRCLVFTWNSVHAGDHDSLVTVEFRPDGKATEVVLTHERLPEAVRAGHIDGWTRLLESLEQNYHSGALLQSPEQKPVHARQQDFTCSITANIPPAQAIDSIVRISEWWAKNFSGNSRQLGDTFTVRFGESFKETFVTFKVVDFVPGAKVVWQVVDCNLHWISNKKEWNDTKVEWIVLPKGNATEVTLTHIGLTHERECYEDCSAGWTGHVTESLFNLMTTGKGQPK